MLFKSGNTFKFNGSDCEMIKVDASSVDYYIENGWYKEWPINEEVKITDQSNDHIRKAAKESGINGWDTKRISTLKELLNGDNEG